jgi:hypothetical protein
MDISLAFIVSLLVYGVIRSYLFIRVSKDPLEKDEVSDESHIITNENIEQIREDKEFVWGFWNINIISFLLLGVGLGIISWIGIDGESTFWDDCNTGGFIGIVKLLALVGGFSIITFIVGIFNFNILTYMAIQSFVLMYKDFPLIEFIPDSAQFISAVVVIPACILKVYLNFHLDEWGNDIDEDNLSDEVRINRMAMSNISRPSNVNNEVDQTDGLFDQFAKGVMYAKTLEKTKEAGLSTSSQIASVIAADKAYDMMKGKKVKPVNSLMVGLLAPGILNDLKKR